MWTTVRTSSKIRTFNCILYSAIFSFFNQREKSPEKAEPQPPIVEVHGSPSAFAAYSAVRQAILNYQIKKTSQQGGPAAGTRDPESDSEEDEEAKEKDILLKIPKVGHQK